MERRKFLLASLLAAPLTTLAKFNFLPKKDLSERPKNGFVVRANESRFFGKKNIVKRHFRSLHNIVGILHYSAYTKTTMVTFGLERTRTEHINLTGKYLRDLNYN